MVPVLLITTFLSYLLVLLIPGDPAQIILEAELQATPSQAQLAAFKSEHGLDKPLMVQYVNWLGRAIH